MLSAKRPSLLYTRFTSKTYLTCRSVALLLALVIAQQSLSVSNAQGSIPYMDKIVHFVAYGALGVFALPALPRVPPVFVIIGLGVFGGLIEYAQGIMGLGRTADFFDAMSNVSGAFMALVFWWGLTKLRL